jgi:hypothetical protein
MVRSRPVRWPIVLVVATAAAAPLPAAASPGDAPWDGAVFAGPTSPHGSNVAANPAAMLLATPAIHYFVGGIAVLEQLGIDRRVVDASGTYSDGPQVSASTFGAGGHAGVATVTARRAFAALVSLPPPDETIAGRDALQYHTRGSRSRAFEGTVSGALRITSRIWFGLGATYVFRNRVLRFSRDTALEAGRDPARGVTSDCGGMPCGLENPLATEVWTVDPDADSPALSDISISNVRAHLSAMFTVPGGTLIGLTYQRPWNLGRIGRDGTVTVIGAPRDGGVVRTGEVTVYTHHPEVIRLGSRSRVHEHLDLVGEVRWKRLSNVGADDIRPYGGDLAAGGVPEIYVRARGMRETVALEAGLEEVDDGQPLRWGGRLGFDTGVVGVEHLSARAPWSRHVTAGGGLQLRLAARWVMQLGYNVAWQLPATVEPGAYDPIDVLDCVDSGHDIDLPACGTVRGGYGAPSAAGEYRRWTHTGRLSLRLEVP